MVAMLDLLGFTFETNGVAVIGKLPLARLPSSHRPLVLGEGGGALLRSPWVAAVMASA